MEVSFYSRAASADTPKHRAWGKIDKEAVKRGCETLWIPRHLGSLPEIEWYASYLLQFTEELLDKTVPWAKGEGKAVSWWSSSVAEAVEEYKKAIRRGETEGQIKRARKKRNRAVYLAKTAHFRNTLQSAATDPSLMWKLVKWGRTASIFPPSRPIVPPLRIGGRPCTGWEQETLEANPNLSWYHAEDFASKVEILQHQFFPARPEADLSDMATATYPRETEDNNPITEEEVRQVIAKLRSGKAPGRTGVTNDFIKLMGEPLVHAVTCLARGCQNWEYFPEAFKVARTVALRKAGKKTYQDPNAWRPIALLETISKIVEAVMAARLRSLSESHGMLPPQQMGARQGKSTETALTMLLSQIRTVWEEEDSVATLLSLDMSGAFPRVLRERLAYTMRMKGVPRWMVNWTSSFMSNRKTTLAFDNQESEILDIPVRIP